MTKYTRKNEKIVLCESNFAKMNILEVLYYLRHRIADDIIEYFTKVSELIVPTIILLSFPISYPIMAYMRIIESKKALKNESKNVELFMNNLTPSEILDLVLKHQDKME